MKTWRLKRKKECLESTEAAPKSTVVYEMQTALHAVFLETLELVESCLWTKVQSTNQGSVPSKVFANGTELEAVAVGCMKSRIASQSSCGNLA